VTSWNPCAKSDANIDGRIAASPSCPSTSYNPARVGGFHGGDVLDLASDSRRCVLARAWACRPKKRWYPAASCWGKVVYTLGPTGIRKRIDDADGTMRGFRLRRPVPAYQRDGHGRG
jgi:hypothetical protein